MVVIVFGLPGSGKSYFAERLAEKLNGRYISSDKVRKEIFDKPTYSLEEKVEVYKKLLEIAYDHAHAKSHLVIDGTFYSKDIKNNFIKMAEDLNLTLYWIEVWAEEEIIKKRVAENRKYSDADYKIYELIKSQYEPFIKSDHLRLKSTNSNIDEMLKKASQYIGVQT